MFCFRIRQYHKRKAKGRERGDIQYMERRDGGMERVKIMLH